MKKKVIIALSLIICLLSAFSSCKLTSSPSGSAQQGTETSAPTESNDTKIKELEAKIISILQNQQLTDAERQKEINALKAEINALKNGITANKESEKDSLSAATDTQTESESKSEFNYVLNGYSATITAISSTEDTVIIPSVIDGHAVKKVGQEVFGKNNSVKRIIISSGIESLDWFAFKNCASLSSITIPSSITSIGYGVFDGTPKSFIIECKKDSFAMKYAQSYGIKYNAN